MECREKFLKLATEEASKSQDPITKVGCIITDDNGTVVSTGFNKPYDGTSFIDSKLTRGQRRECMVHAEQVALLSAQRKGKVAYCTVAPCLDCLKLLIFSGIEKIFYDECLASNKVIEQKKLEQLTRIVQKSNVRILNLNSQEHFLDELNKYRKE